MLLLRCPVQSTERYDRGRRRRKRTRSEVHFAYQLMALLLFRGFFFSLSKTPHAWVPGAAQFEASRVPVLIHMVTTENANASLFWLSNDLDPLLDLLVVDLRDLKDEPTIWRALKHQRQGQGKSFPCQCIGLDVKHISGDAPGTSVSRFLNCKENSWFLLGLDSVLPGDDAFHSLTQLNGPAEDGWDGSMRTFAGQGNRTRIKLSAKPSAIRQAQSKLFGRSSRQTQQATCYVVTTRRKVGCFSKRGALGIKDDDATYRLPSPSSDSMLRFWPDRVSASKSQTRHD